jgi:molecular chaperone GrpE
MSKETTDETAEPTTATEQAGGAEQSADSLLTQLQADIESYRDLALRSKADLDNFRKRAAREKEDATKYANASFLERLIPILDNFELGLNAARAGSENSPILAGMDMVARQLNDFLTSSGVEPINAEGQQFDPNLHEAVGQEESATIAEGVIIRQLRKGYKLRDRLLRPATVMVSKGPGTASK